MVVIYQYCIVYYIKDKWLIMYYTITGHNTKTRVEGQWRDSE